jgi:magnesium transporter
MLYEDKGVMAEDFSEHLKKPVKLFAKREFSLLRDESSIADALDSIRKEGLPDGVVYFYVGDAEGRLVGVLPSRRILTAPPEKSLSELMIRRVISVPETASLLDACELFVLYKLLAIPIVDINRRLTGVVDISVFTEEMLSFDDKPRADEIFQTIGFHVGELRNASAWKAFRYRFPWLLTTIGGGMLCAAVSNYFATTLESRIILALFMTLVLGLGESVSAQSMALALQQLQGGQLTVRGFLSAIKKEFFSAFLLGSACGAVVGTVVWLSKGDPGAAFAIGLSVVFSMICACIIGLSIPSILRWLQLDPRVASGPLALALADVCTLFCYFSVAQSLL